MLVHGVSADNACGDLGPTFGDNVISMPISDVLTMQPYANAAATTRMGPPRQLTLTDFDNCPALTKSLWDLIPVIADEHPNMDTFNRCNPHLAVPAALRALGG